MTYTLLRCLVAPAVLLAAAALGGCAVYPAYPARPYAAAYPAYVGAPVVAPIVVGGGWGWRGRYWR